MDENIVAKLVQQGTVTDTFRRLAPDKKDQIYRAAIKLFGKYGYDGLPVQRLCREAGISKGSFFQYFPSKSHLLEFAVLIFDDYLARWMVEINRGESSSLARNRLLHLCQALVVNSKLYAAEQKFYLFICHGMNHAAVELKGIDIEGHFTRYVTEIIRRGEQTGEIRGDIAVELTSHVTSLVIGALVRGQYSAGILARRQITEYLISCLFDGIRA